MSDQIESLLKTANSTNAPVNSVTSARRDMADADAARELFGAVCSNLFDIKKWGEHSSPSDYVLFDRSGRDVSGQPIVEGAFIRISIYGSGKNDWVQVESILRSENEMVITVKPTYDPTAEPRDTGTISHFFHSEARNNFCVQLDGAVVNFYVIGLNERQNVSETESVVETVRNSAVANVGYYTGSQKAIWAEFSKNFLRTDEERADGKD
ncbi:MAG: hypothetical protein ABI791_08570 [Acidobacteriota bacterium]